MRRRVILVDSAQSWPEKRCALAHAIAHLDLGHTPSTGLLGRMYEAQADRLAAERLMPLDLLADALTWALGPDEVAHELDVTEQMVLVRVRGLTDAERAAVTEAVGRRGEVA